MRCARRLRCPGCEMVRSVQDRPAVEDPAAATSADRTFWRCPGLRLDRGVRGGRGVGHLASAVLVAAAPGGSLGRGWCGAGQLAGDRGRWRGRHGCRGSRWCAGCGCPTGAWRRAAGAGSGRRPTAQPSRRGDGAPVPHPTGAENCQLGGSRLRAVVSPYRGTGGPPRRFRLPMRWRGGGSARSGGAGQRRMRAGAGSGALPAVLGKVARAAADATGGCDGAVTHLRLDAPPHRCSHLRCQPGRLPGPRSAGLDGHVRRSRRPVPSTHSSGAGSLGRN
jgi:hypothetical protein